MGRTRKPIDLDDARKLLDEAKPKKKRGRTRTEKHAWIQRSISIPQEMADALRRLSGARHLCGVEPCHQRDIVVTALREYLAKHPVKKLLAKYAAEQD